MIDLKLSISSDSRYQFDRKKVKTAVEEVLREQECEGVYKISLAVVGERKIRDLEKKFFGEDKVTDVLSFPQNEGEVMPPDEDGNNLGDIVICYPQAKRQALMWNRTIDDEVCFLAGHGTLHLLGVHHD